MLKFIIIELFELIYNLIKKYKSRCLIKNDVIIIIIRKSNRNYKRLLNDLVLNNSNYLFSITKLDHLENLKVLIKQQSKF